MKARTKRMALVGGAVLLLGAAVALVLTAFQQNLVFFHTPSDISEKKIPAGQRIRLGGLVADGSVKRGGGAEVEFAVTDTLKTIAVAYKGILPDLFREGQGVVAEGSLGPDGVFIAREVLAKHDENYMPPEVARAIKEAGQWKEKK